MNLDACHQVVRDPCQGFGVDDLAIGPHEAVDLVEVVSAGHLHGANVRAKTRGLQWIGPTPDGTTDRMRGSCPFRAVATMGVTGGISMCGMIIFDGLLILGGLWLSDVVGAMWPLYVAVFMVAAPVIVWLFVAFMSAKEVRDEQRTFREAMSRANVPSDPSRSTPASRNEQSTSVIVCEHCGQKNRVKEGFASRCGRCGADVGDEYCYTYVKQGDGYCAICGTHYRNHVRGRPRDR